MAEWNDNTKHPKSSINNGQQYTKDDNVTLESLNNTIENSFYAVRVAENAQSATNNAVSYNTQIPSASEQIQAQKNLGIDQTITFAESERQKSITDGAIVHEKQIAGVEHVETIYDMTSSDANINKGYTSGISGNTTIQNLNFSKYKRLKIYSRDYWGTVGIGEIDFSVISMNGNFYSGMAIVGNRYYNDDNGDIFTEMIYFHRYKVNSSKTTFNLIVERRPWTNQPSCSGEMISDTDNIVYRIEGVY